MKAFIPAIVWALLILYLSTGPGISLPVKWWDLLAPDKIGHAVFYGILVILILWGFGQQAPLSQKIAWGVVLGASAYGIGMEVIQYAFFPGRYFEVLDIIANIIGTIAGLIIFYSKT